MKRLFIILAAALTLASACTAAPEKKEIGIQLYSVRQLLSPRNYDEAHEALFSKLAELGYTSIEAASYNDGKFYGADPAQFKADLAAAGLKAVSSHTNKGLSKEEYETGDFTESLNWWKENIPAHIAAGMTHIVIPSFAIPDNLKDLKTYCDYLNAVGKLCSEQGLKFGYHNHSGEFRKVEGKTVYDFMIENTDPNYVFFEMDVYWAVVGDASPVYYFKTYPGRFALLHIKDWKEVGQSGMVGFDAIFNNFDVAGCKGFIVEMEASSYNDILRTCQESADYLINADFVKPSYAE